jgi:raffinose/stachyose/melibiose transport system substrate-binding protein
MLQMNSSSKRPEIIMLILLLLPLLLSACNSSDPSLAPTPTAEPAQQPTETSEEVVLTMGSWRPDDVEQMNRILAEFHRQHPNITIQYKPTSPPEYNAVLEAQLENGNAPDLFYLRSFAVSQDLYQRGYIEPLDSLPGLTDQFEQAMLLPWTGEDGMVYGVPFIATSHGIYYNADLFDSLDLEVPETWDDLLEAADIIQENGYIPFANASGDSWTMAELVFMNLAPTFIGGREGRMAYLSGQRCFNDDHIVATFDAVRQIAPYMPDNQNLLTYSDSLQLFLQGEAAMWLGGSWDIAFFEAEQPDFDWSVFVIPPPAGQPQYVTFQLDAGMGLNAASNHKEEAMLFLEWVTTPEFGEMLGNELPGFFPMHTQAPELDNPQANTFLELSSAYETDIRFTWEDLMEGLPSAYTLIEDGTMAVVSGELTPQQAADQLQTGLAEWFEPAQSCGE